MESFWGVLDVFEAAYLGLGGASSARGCQPGEAGCIQPLHLGRQPCRGDPCSHQLQGAHYVVETCRVEA